MADSPQRFSVVDVLEQIRDGVSPAGTPSASAGVTDAQMRAAPLVVTEGSDVTVSGPAAQSVLNTDLLTGTVNGWYDGAMFRTGVVQVIGSAGISAGAVIFEQTNDPVLAAAGVPLAAAEVAVLNINPYAAAFNIVASTSRLFAVSLMARYFRVRISTAFTGGTVRAVAVLSQDVFANTTLNVQQASAGLLQMSASLLAGTALVGDVSIQPRAGAGGLSVNTRILSAAAGTNGTVVKATAGRLYKVRGYNAAAAVRYLKFSNSATITVGTTAVVDTFALAPSSMFDIDFGAIGRVFSTGICFGLTTGVADNDVGALTAADIVGLNVYYV